MVSPCLIIARGISTSSANYGKRNFRKFMIYGKRGSKLHKEREAGPNPELPVDKRGVRDIGYKDGLRHVVIPEMVPEIIVPSLEGCKLKPYVTYESTEVYQEEFTAKDLFDAVYSPKITEDFSNKKLKPDGQPLHPSDEEKLTPEEAKMRADQTGSDMFQVKRREVFKAYDKAIYDAKEAAKKIRQPVHSLNRFDNRTYDPK